MGMSPFLSWLSRRPAPSQQKYAAGARNGSDRLRVRTSLPARPPSRACPEPMVRAADAVFAVRQWLRRR